MAQIMGILAFLVSIYMVIIFFRIILTWFSGVNHGGLQDILAGITDPYLNWFRRFPALKTGFLDLSPIVALGVLSLVNRIFSTLARYGTITIGIILSMVLQVLWGLVSFFLGFLIIILIIRLIAHLMRLNTHGQFWRVVNVISQPVLYRINSFFAKNRILDFGIAIIISIVCLGIGYFVLRILVSFVFAALIRLPF